MNNSELNFQLIRQKIIMGLFGSKKNVDYFQEGIRNFQEGNVKKAVSNFKKGAKEGSVECAFNLGVLYQTGNGVEQNLKESFNYYKQAADSGLPKAEYQVAMMYATGTGTPVDMMKSHEYFTYAAHHGNADAQEKLKELDAIIKGNKK